MGIDLLDIRFRLEKRFNIALIRQQFDADLWELAHRRQPPDFTAGEISVWMSVRFSRTR